MLLLEQGHDVSIVGRNIPGDLDINYTSPYAGANWQSFAANDDIKQQNIDKAAYKKFMELAKDPASGIFVASSYNYLSEHEYAESGFEFPWFKDFVHNFQILDKSELPEGMAFGYKFDSVTVTVNIYLHYLLQKVFRLGGTLQRKHIHHINECYSLHHSGLKADLIVNCSGLLARELGGVKDSKVYPVKGQIIWARNNITKQCCDTYVEGHPFELTYMMPRKEGGCIIGGTMVPNDYGETPDYELAKRTIQRAIKLNPELVDPKLGNPSEIDIVKVNVGLRPARKGGVRIEREGNIIHNYGIAGAGYQASYGLAELVVTLADEFFAKSKL